MTPPVGGIDPHQDTFTVGIFDAAGVERVGVEGSAKWGAHVAVALVAAGFDAREIPASRSAAQRRSRRPGQDRRR